MNKNRRTFLLSCLFFALITIVIIFSWFRYGHLYGGGDVGLPSYDPTRALEITKNVWWEASAPGTAIPQGLTSVPFQYFQSVLQNLGLPPFIIQAIVFGILLFLSGFGMYLIGLTVFGKDKFYLAIFAGLFYMFNPYMMIQVWHRFIHNAFFLSAALPFFFLSFRSWVKTGKYSYLLLFLLTNFIAVYLYGTIAFIFTILTLLLFIYGIEVVFPWKGISYLKYISFRALVGIVSWLIFHSWWLLPVINVSPAVLSAQHSVADNLSTLISISAQTIIPYSLLGINPFYLYTQEDFGQLYNTYFFRFLLWLSLIFLVPGFILALKNKKWVIWALLAVLAIFLSKGATSPFGFPYILGFSNLFPLGVLRNPFEKIGILIPFAYAILLPLGIDWYLEKIRNNFKLISKLTILIILFFILGVNLWPMWLGYMFGKYNKLAFITVPASYPKVDEYIGSQKKPGRILHLPLTTSESVAYYIWKHGYSGVEPSQLLFKSLPSISRGLNVGSVDDALGALAYIFSSQNSKDKILNLLQAFNVRFIILHRDVQWRGGYLIEPQKIESILDKLDFLEKKLEFEDLVVYELKGEHFGEKIRLTDDILYYFPSERNIYWPWLLAENNKDIISPVNKDKDITLKPGQLSIAAENAFVYSPQVIRRENLLGEMPAIKFLPNSPLYLFIKLKEQILLFTLSTNDRFIFKVTIAGKRLTESLLSKDRALQKSIIPQIKEYRQLLEDIKGGIQAHNRQAEVGKEISLNFIFSRHIATLNLIREKADDQEKQVIDEALNQLTGILKETNTIPYNNLIENEAFPTLERLVSRFNLPMSGQYELLQANSGIQDIYPNGLSVNTFQINNGLSKLQGRISYNFVSYGKVDLPKGNNEISFSPVPSKNLADFSKDLYSGDVKKLNNEVEITSDQHSLSYMDINISQLRGGDEYQLNFESWIKLGERFRIQVIQDTDNFDPDNPGEKSYDNNFPRSTYENYWVGHNFKFFINPATTKATIRLIVDPWDGCKHFQVIKSVCHNKQVSYLYERPSKVVFRNIQIVRLLTNSLFLRLNALQSITNKSIGKVDFIQNSPTSYSGKINLSSPGYFIFNETFHPGWKLELLGDKKFIPTQKVVSNLYGNGWFIEEPGEYNFKLEFTPQRNVTYGIIISGICFVSILMLTAKQILKNE